MGARGNSGVILSQLWRGFARAVDHQEILDATSLAHAFSVARDTAYKGVVRPVEGTILTVAKGIAAATEAALVSTQDPYELLEIAVKAADEAVQSTPDLLPVLKQAGVVDSGGKGLFFILEGMLRHVYGATLDTPIMSVQPISAMNLQGAMEEVEEGQDYEVVVDFFPSSQLDLPKFYGRLEGMGTSIQVGEGEGMYRMHIHVPTEKRYEPIDYIMGIGTITDIGYMLIAPVRCMIIAIMAELGTVLTFPIAVAMGLTYKEAAAVAMVGGADGPMVLYASLILARDLFVPITIVAYLYLSLTYAGYPYLVRLLVPKELRGIKMDMKGAPKVTPGQKITFSVVVCTLLCLLFPVAAPLFLSFFLGVVVRESGIKQYVEFLSGTVLYGSTFFLGLMLGVLFEANTILNPKVLLLLFLGMVALLLSGIGGIIGGYIVYWMSGRTFNPVVGIAGVSCLPTTAKVAQKEAHSANKFAMILPWAMGASVSGVITSAILTGIYVSVLQHTP